MRIKMKWVALFLVIVMQMATVPQNISASPTATLIFDMNLDGVTAEDGTGYVTNGVTNSVTGTTTTIAGKSRDDSAARPILGVDEGVGFKFLKFSTPVENALRENNQAGLEVTFNDESYFNNNEFTFETWARGTNLWQNGGPVTPNGNYYAYLGLFTLGTKPTATETAFSTSTAYFGTFFGTGSAHNLYNLNYNATSVNKCVESASGSTSVSTQHTFGGTANTLYTYEGELKHYAVTMKWELNTETTDSETDGTWTSDLYVNGVKTYTLTRQEASRHTFTESEIPTLLVGAAPHSEATFCGDIADFKMYTGVRTAEEILATYKAERPTYIEMTDVESHTLNEVTRDNRDFTITFDEPVDATTVNANNISVEKADGTKLGLLETNPYNENTRTVNFKLLDYFRYNTKYYLCLTGVKDANGMELKREKIEFTSRGHDGISISEPILTDKDNKPITEIGENTSAKISVTVTGAPEKIISLVMVIYNGNRIVKMVPKEEAIGNSGSKTYTVSTEDARITLEPGYKIKAFICSMDGEKGAVAFFDPIEIH